MLKSDGPFTHLRKRILDIIPAVCPQSFASTIPFPLIPPQSLPFLYFMRSFHLYFALSNVQVANTLSCHSHEGCSEFEGVYHSCVCTANVLHYCANAKRSRGATTIFHQALGEGGTHTTTKRRPSPMGGLLPPQPVGITGHETILIAISIIIPLVPRR
jgi:hypothetical protein